MKKGLAFLTISHEAWTDFCKHWLAWVGLAAGGIIIMFGAIAAHVYLPEYRHAISFVLCGVGALYTAILHQNGLDAAYGRTLNMLNITKSIIFASLFFIAISLYNPFPEYSEFLFFILPADFKFLMVLNWVIHLIVSYLLFRCMFVGMIILEKKSNVIAAFKESFLLTAHHLLLLFGIFMYLAILLSLSAFTVIGYFIALPYTMIMKSMVFKRLQEIVHQDTK